MCIYIYISASLSFGAKDNTPDLTKVKIRWKTPLRIHWKVPVKLHWRSDNPF